ncbi:MAG TPA: dTDP-4-dehydrorhamnose 3,5-epimerase family protein [bacterium]|nr:dTDP-4-dehydrorhamnose 3,5-epimerase family protein [bacterium]HOL47265.1 dTDP-4-dehydrorhamnose 3,5-epimerase family protein [bacterium]HPQ19630.1 dTDP-4-dehydrorhamnose 3,5-epimerase family protein [bacterium]
MSKNIEGVQIIKLEKKEDERGYFIELIQSQYVEKQDKFGLVYISQAKAKGVIKGNHYHTRKTEYFTIIKGNAELHLYEIKTGKRDMIVFGEDNYCMVKVPPGIVHTFVNIGDGEMILAAYISEPFNKDDPDTIFHKII